MKKVLLTLIAVADCMFAVVAGVRAAERVAVPAGPDGLAPQLSAGAGGILLSWLQPEGDGHRLRFSSWQGDGWSAARTAAAGERWFVNWADRPSVVAVDDGFWFAHWLVRRPAGGYAYDIRVATSRDGGSTWSDGIATHRDDTDTEHGFLSTWPEAGGLGLAWLDGRRMADGGGMTLRAATLTADGQLAGRAELDGLTCDCCETASARSADGPLVVYRDRTPDEIRDIAIVRGSGNGWSAGELVAEDGWEIAGCPVNGPAVAVRGPEVTVAWFTAANDVPRVRLARSARADGGFSTAVDVVAGDTAGRTGLVVLEDGSAVVSSVDRNSAGTMVLALRRVGPDDAVGPALTVASGLPRFGVPQLVRDGETLVLAWPESGGIASAMLPVSALPR